MITIFSIDSWDFPIHTSDYWMITSPFGYRISPILNVAKKHEGIDIAAVRYAQVVSVESGTVIQNWPSPGTPTGQGTVFRGHPVWGGYLIIDHGNGFTSHYAHLSSTFVRQNQTVKKGQVIGRIGNTGLTHGYGHHLHFELRHNDKPVNPLLYITYPEDLEIES